MSRTRSGSSPSTVQTSKQQVSRSASHDINLSSDHRQQTPTACSESHLLASAKRRLDPIKDRCGPASRTPSPRSGRHCFLVGALGGTAEASGAKARLQVFPTKVKRDPKQAALR